MRTEENVDVESVLEQDGVEIIHVVNCKSYNYLLDRNSVLFVYNPGSSLQISWPDHHVSNSLSTSKILSYTFPLKDTRIELSGSGEIFLLRFTLARLHQFFGSSFGQDQDEVQAFASSLRSKDLFSEKEVGAELSIVFHQMFNHRMEGPFQKIYLEGKLMEFLSHFMNRPAPKKELELSCPFINDDAEMDRIRQARDIIIAKMLNPPSLKELAREVGTNEFKLKVGFKNLFGDTVFGYLTHYKMEKARGLILNQKLSVKQVSSEVGYANSSHFIAAYKRKFGITPKKHLQSIA